MTLMIMTTYHKKMSIADTFKGEINELITSPILSTAYQSVEKS